MVTETLNIQTGDATITGDLVIPPDAAAIVIFSHGSGSSRFSPRNRSVADVLQREGFATLLVDLLTEEEDRDYGNRFDINLLTTRLIEVTRWINENEKTKDLAVGYFGASTGAASALAAAARLGDSIKAVVSRGGRPDLALADLPKVTAPVLLIVGGLDTAVIELNRKAYLNLTNAARELIIVPGATHLFEEPGKLKEVARLALGWFEGHLQEKF